jgi:hypothetical protein
MTSTIPWSSTTTEKITTGNGANITEKTIPGTDNVLSEHYKEHGQWARHYSTVRMTLGTFFLTFAFGILQFRWDKPETEVAIIAGGVFLLGLVVFLLFSLATFNEMNNQLKIVNAYRKSLNTSTVPLYGRNTLSGWPLAILFLLLFGFVVCKFWTLAETKATKGAEVMVPLVLQSGEKRTTFQVPIEISIDQTKSPTTLEKRDEKKLDNK